MDHKHTLVFLDTAKEFIGRYEEELIKRYADRVDIHIITDNEFAEDYFNTMESIDLLILPEADYHDSLQGKKLRRILLLKNEIDEEESDLPRNVKVMLNFLPPEEIFEEITDFFARLDLEMTAPEEKEGKGTKVIAVYSPIGGCGKSLMAIGLARKLKRLDQKVLLVGCDDLQSFEVFMEDNDYADDGLAEALREPNEDTYWTILQNIGYDEFSYLKPFRRVPHAVGVGRTQMRSFVNLMREKGDFDILILDVGTRVDEAGVGLMERADEIVLITEPTIAAMRKMARIAGDDAMLPQKKCILVSNQYHSDGLRYSEDAIFDSLPAYVSWQDAVEDPIFYRLALCLQDEGK